MKGLLTH